MADKNPKDTYIAAVKEATKRAVSAGKPHYYGRIGNVHVFHAMHDAHSSLVGKHLNDPTDEHLQTALAEAGSSGHGSIVIHGNPPPSLRPKAFEAQHGHNYDWHDGHTGHYLEDKIKKADVETTDHGREHLTAHTETYKPIAKNFGAVNKTKNTNLQFYRGIEHSEDKVDELIKKHGYEVRNKAYGDAPEHHKYNYDTKHLTVYFNPKDEKNSGYSRTYRKLHELSHALTRDQVNNLYGEGKRVGKLGVRTPREAKRAVHWEWLAAHKQRDLANQIGHKLSDEDFGREVNTVMHDGVHRALTGNHVNASEAGFWPKDDKQPVETSLKIVDDAQKGMGLTHDEATHSSAAVSKEMKDVLQAITKAEGKVGPLFEGGKMRRFYLQRDDDETGMSGTGRVAEGVEFSNGWCGMNWLSRWGSVCFYPSMEALKKIHGHGGKTQIIFEDEQDMKKNLKKAFTQGDGETLVDPREHNTAAGNVPQPLIEWGQKHLVALGKDDVATLELDGKTIKVRKVIEDMYSGWIEKEGQIIHAFERLTLPSLLVQMQSKLELYGREKEAVDATEPKIEGIDQKLKDLQSKIAEHTEEISSKDLTLGIENPEKECPACEHPSDKCICYTGLPQPRIEFDMEKKKMTIFFKSEWDEEDRINFRNDFMRRCGTILERRRVDQAKQALATIRNKLGKKDE